MTKTGKPPVVLLHGAFADHHTFRHWLPRLAAAGHLAIAPARRGRVGFGPDRAEGLTVEDYLEDTLGVLDRLDAPPVLIGAQSRRTARAEARRARPGHMRSS